jgi:hypothetical protein|tara:strand:- start:229136 stop:229453 length:318 start_codon:yes stop_codon:yes gene_type:complete
MTDDQHPHPGQEPGVAAPRRRMPLSAWAIIGLAVIGIVIYLFIDHLPHVLAALPYVAIIGMAAMHLFGHGHHGGSHHTNHDHAPRARQDGAAADGETSNGPRDPS